MSQSLVVVYESPQRVDCMEMRLVLNSIGLPAQVAHQRNRWQLRVAEGQRDQAVAELTGYEQDERDVTVAKTAERVALDKGTIEGVMVFILVIATCSVLNWYAPAGAMMSEAGQVDAGLVQNGEWWRTVTALTLHSDWTHLLSNMVFGALFGILAGRWLGGGIAWLLIVAGGALGNLINSYCHDATHLSIGASTAVFAALGIAVANALRPSLKKHTRAMRQWSPLIAGGVLLSMMGTGGEQTDVGAHVAGFVAGLIGGWLSSYLPHRWLTNPSNQSLAGLAAVCVVAFSWAIGWSS